MKRSFMQARTGMVLLLAMVSVSICFAHGADGWEPDSCTNHTCTAGPINAGNVTYVDGTMWRGHNAHYAKGANSDIDCHKKADGSYEDVAETSFTVDWKVQMYENGQWVDKGVVSGNVTSANWYTAGFAPGYEYRMKTFTNDTAGGGRDDPGVYKYSAGQTLQAPGVYNWAHDNANYPLTPANGDLVNHFTWGSTCGHMAHLDKVTVREKVTFEAAHTANGTHDISHTVNGQPSNCFSQADNQPDPTLLGVPGTNDPDGNGVPEAFDTHSIYATLPNKWASYCECYQKYQWATGWPNAPDASATNVTWNDLDSYTIKRYVENVGGWRYRITKGSWSNTFVY